MSKWLTEVMDERTRVQVKCPHVVQEFPIDLTTKDEELGADHRHRMTITTDGPGPSDHNAGPLSRHWVAR